MKLLSDRPRRVGTLPTFLFLVSLVVGPAIAHAAHHEGEEKPPASELDAVIGALKSSKPIFHMVARYEYGKANGLEHSHAPTLRTRFGIQSGTYRGFTGLIEGVNTFSAFSSEYFDAQAPNSAGQTPVADAERTDVNRFWLQYANKELLDSKLKAGRQRIKLDDDRWIGNVGWRQNEQTFDAARLQTTLGQDNLLFQYMYVWEVHRIFADQGAAGQRDFDPNGHFFNIAYKAHPAAKVVAFAYLIDSDAPATAGFGSATFGTRVSGKVKLNDTFSVPYQLSYAFQQDYRSNPVDYDAHYGFAELGLSMKKVGTVAAGYEHLGTDDGNARIVTPFSTAHKFNGFADVFLNNGGLRGLRDFWVSFSPALPVKGLKAKFWFHQFWEDQGGATLGEEYNAVISYAVNKHLSFLWKGAYFDGGKNNRSPGTTARSIIDMTIKF